MTSTPDVLMIGPYPAWDLEPMTAAYRLHRLWEAEDRQASLEQVAPSVRAIATRGELGADAELIAQLPALEIIACYGVGTDAINLAAARERGIRVTNTPDVLTGDVADIGVGLALALLRRIPQADAFVRSGAWAQGNMGLVRRLYGKRVGVVGFGRIGTTFAKRLSGFDVEIGYFDVAPQAGSAHTFFGSLSELAQWCSRPAARPRTASSMRRCCARSALTAISSTSRAAPPSTSRHCSRRWSASRLQAPRSTCFSMSRASTRAS